MSINYHPVNTLATALTVTDLRTRARAFSVQGPPFCSSASAGCSPRPCINGTSPPLSSDAGFQVDFSFAFSSQFIIPFDTGFRADWQMDCPAKLFQRLPSGVVSPSSSRSMVVLLEGVEVAGNEATGGSGGGMFVDPKDSPSSHNVTLVVHNATVAGAGRSE